MGGGPRLQPGRPDQDRHRGQRAGPQHPRSTAAAGSPGSRPCRRASAAGSGSPSRTRAPASPTCAQALRDGYTTGTGLGPGSGRRPASRRTSSTSPRRPARAPACASRGGSDRRRAPRCRSRSPSRARWARRGGRSWPPPQAVGLDATEQGKLALVVTELGTNLVKHAAAGRADRPARAGGSGGGRAARPGPAGRAWGASAGASGTATRPRAARAPGWARSRAPRRRLRRVLDPAGGHRHRGPRLGADAPPRPASRSGAVSLPMAGEEVCGDAWAVAAAQECPAVMVVDGLGHGPGAADAARRGGAGLRGVPGAAAAGPGRGHPRRAPRHPRRRGGGGAHRPGARRR